MTISLRRSEYRELPTTQYALPALVETRQVAPVDIVGASKSMMQALLKGQGYVSGRVGKSVIEALIAANISDERGGIPIAVNDQLPKNRVFAWA